MQFYVCELSSIIIRGSSSRIINVSKIEISNQTETKPTESTTTLYQHGVIETKAAWMKYQTKNKCEWMSYSRCDRSDSKFRERERESEKEWERDERKNTETRSNSHVQPTTKIQLIRCHLTCMTVVTHSTRQILATKKKNQAPKEWNKCAQHACTLAYVGTKQIEKLEALCWQRSSLCMIPS